MSTDVVRPAEPGWIINCRLESHRCHWTDAGDCHESPANLVVLGQAQQGTMQICQGFLHCCPPCEQRLDAQFQQCLSSDQLEGPRFEVPRRDLADLVERGLLLKIGEKRGAYYILK